MMSSGPAKIKMLGCASNGSEQRRDRCAAGRGATGRSATSSTSQGLRGVCFIALGVAALGFLAGCSHKADDSAVLARVGQRVITIDEFEKEAQWRVRNQRALPGKQALLEEMIALETRLQKAR